VQRLRKVLAPASVPEVPTRREDSEMDLVFEDDAEEGVLRVGGEEYPASLRALPTVVESYKTLNDVDLVKAGDIGQVILVRPKGSAPPPPGEYRDGVTPPMRRARQRVFRAHPSLDDETFEVSEGDRAIVQRVEAALLRLLAGGAPEGVEIWDYEEEWDEEEMRWVPAQPRKKKVGKHAPVVKIERRAAGAGAGGGAGGDEDEDEDDDEDDGLD